MLSVCFLKACFRAQYYMHRRRRTKLRSHCPYLCMSSEILEGWDEGELYLRNPCGSNVGLLLNNCANVKECVEVRGQRRVTPFEMNVSLFIRKGNVNEP